MKRNLLLIGLMPLIGERSMVAGSWWLGGVFLVLGELACGSLALCIWFTIPFNVV